MTMKAYYSRQMAEKFPDTIVYWKNFDGVTVECTCVGEKGHGTKWPDIEDRGPVKDFAGRKFPMAARERAQMLRSALPD